MAILFCDQNPSLIDKVSDAGIPNLITVCDDIFKYSGVIVSASNPRFTFGGGLDALIAKHYPKECNEKLYYENSLELNLGNQRIGNVIFTITVNEQLQATPELVTEALLFALKNIQPQETLLLTGLGTGIGGLDEDLFVSILKDVLLQGYT